MKRLSIGLFFLCLAAGLAGAQEDGQEETPPRRAVILVQALQQEAPDSLTSRILNTNVEDLLASYGMTYRSVELNTQPGSPTLPDEQRISVILGSVQDDEADVVIGVFYLTADNQLFVQFVLYDPMVDTVLGGVLTRSRQGLTVFDSVATAVEDFRPVIERYLAGEYFAEERTGLVESILVEGGTEGAQIFFVDRLVGTVGGGELFVPFTQFEIGTRLRVQQVKEGYHDTEEIVPLETSQVTMSLLPLRRETRFDLGLRWSWGLAQGLGFGARYHIVPDTTFVALEHYRTFQPAPTAKARDVQFYDSNISVGRYFFFPYRSLFRLSLSLGLGVLISDVDDLLGREYTDWYLLVGNPTAELNLDRLGFFVRPELKYALGLGYNVLGRVWIRTTYETREGSIALPPITFGVRYSW
jgi:hypothetical protein